MQTRDLKEERQQLREDLSRLRTAFEASHAHPPSALSPAGEASHQAALQAAAIVARDFERAAATERLAHAVSEERSAARRTRHGILSLRVLGFSIRVWGKGSAAPHAAPGTAILV